MVSVALVAACDTRARGQLAGQHRRDVYSTDAQGCLRHAAIRDFSFSATDGSATVVQLNVVVFSTTKIHPKSTVIEIEGRPSSKPTHAQMTPNVIFTVAEPSVVENEKSLIIIIVITSS